MFYFAKSWADGRYYAPYLSKNNVTTWETKGGEFAQESKYEPFYDQNGSISGYYGVTTFFRDSVTTRFSIRHIYEE